MIGLSFLLLMVAFRSLVIPLTAAVMNLFAAGASFGLIVAIFQWGWGSELLGIGKGGPIEPFVPVMFFAILFGLSMDYQVFLVSRMHEEWVHTRDNRRAITVGQAETGGIITAAAIIMIAVFGGFILGDNRVIKLFGIGLARRDLHRRVHPAHDPGAVADAPVRQGQLVVPEGSSTRSHRRSRSRLPTPSTPRTTWPRSADPPAHRTPVVRTGPAAFCVRAPGKASAVRGQRIVQPGPELRRPRRRGRPACPRTGDG